jgi:hypothetical protein
MAWRFAHNHTTEKINVTKTDEDTGKYPVANFHNSRVYMVFGVFSGGVYVKSTDFEQYFSAKITIYEETWSSLIAADFTLSFN